LTILSQGTYATKITESPRPARRLGWLLWAAAFPAWASDGDGPEKPAQVSNGWHAASSFFEEYRLRIAHDALSASGPLGSAPATNQTADQHLRGLADVQLSGPDDHFLALASAGLWLDLDHRPAPGTPSIFATEYDYAQPWWVVYSLSAEWHDYRVLEHLRVGRQATEHGLPLTFDGLSVGVRPLGPGLSLFGFGGRTVHFFETGAGFWENWVASVGTTLRPTPNLSLEIDSRLIQQGVPNQDGSARTQVRNHSYGLTASHRSDTAYAKVFVRGLDERASHVGGALQMSFPSAGMGIDSALHAQLVTLGEVVESENPYFSLLGPSLPYVRLRLEGWKEVALGDTTLGLHLGWRERQLINAAERPFNRNTGGVYLLARLDDLVQRGLFLSGTAEYDYVPWSHPHDRFWALGGSTGYTTQAVKTEVGTYYQQFKILYYQRAEELLNSRTIYASMSYRLASWLELRARYEFEILDRYLESFFFSLRQDF
jgi:hypothetical protein